MEMRVSFCWGKGFQTPCNSGWRRDLGNGDPKSPRSILFSFILLAQFYGLLMCIDWLVLGFFLPVF